MPATTVAVITGQEDGAKLHIPIKAASAGKKHQFNAPTRPFHMLQLAIDMQNCVRIALLEPLPPGHADRGMQLV